jgi:uncharacterized integral membrane protein
MSSYTVHEPPLQAGAAAPEPERYVFVRDGFSFWAFLFGPLWMLRHRMWLVLVLYAVISVALSLVFVIADAPRFVIGLIAFLIALLVGLEAGTLRRFTLHRRGWKYVGVVTGEDRLDAERRFFAAWLQAGTRPAAPVVPVPSPLPLPPHQPRTSDVIGLFPEPGASR